MEEILNSQGAVLQSDFYISQKKIIKAQKNHEGQTFIWVLSLLEDTACYAGLLLAPAEGFGLRPRQSADLRKRGKTVLVRIYMINNPPEIHLDRYFSFIQNRWAKQALAHSF